MKSMTGFAKVQTEEINGRQYTIEIKTLNSKQLDSIVKLPSALRACELQIRAMLNRLERGKIDVVVSEKQGIAGELSLNAQLAEQRLKELRLMTHEIGCPMTDGELLTIILKQPDVWSATDERELSQDDCQRLFSAIDQAITEVDQTRQHEGEILEKDFHIHIDQIECCLKQIPPFEDERMTTAKERIRSLLANTSVEVDENRFEQELIYYLEKLDITEEKVRLQKHINYFREVMTHEESCGKKLGFIAQEMGREINTTGSKANHVEIQRLVVAMKDELEKIKEQLGNIL